MGDPIIEQDFAAGVKVVHIEDLRIARGLTRRPHSACRHVQLVYDGRERRIWCQDCETDVDAFQAFEMLVERWSAGVQSIERRQRQVEEAEARSLVSRAARVMDEVWRSRNMVPCCPNCSKPLLAERIVKGIATMSKELALRIMANKGTGR